MITLTFDLGGTGLRARVGAQGQTLAEFSADGYSADVTLNEQLLAVAHRAAEVSGVRRIDAMAGGLTGVHGAVPNIDIPAARLRAEFGVRRLIVADDALTSYFGALGDDAGVVAAIGTGLVVLGHGRAGHFARVDGLGPMVGDEGAGWWIGRQGLIAAFSAVDGRDHGSPMLLSAARARYGPTQEIPGLLAHAPSPHAAVAAFAIDVAEAARAGDVTAQGIWASATEFIARAIAAGAERAELTSPLTYALLGGIGRATDLLEPRLSVALRSRFERVKRISPRGTGLDGAAALLHLDKIDRSNPLIRHITLTEG